MIEPFHQLGPLSYQILPGSFVRRGWADVLPKKLSSAKLLATVIHQLGSTTYAEKPRLSVFSDVSQQELSHLPRLVRDVAPLNLMSFSYDLFWEALGQIAGAQAFAFLAKGQTAYDDQWLRRTDALSTLRPEIAASVTSALEQAADRDMTYPDVVFETVPGKTKLLDIESRSLQIFKKQLKADMKLSNRAYQKVVADRRVEPGWGCGGFVVDTNQATRHLFYGRYDLGEQALSSLSLASTMLDLVENLLSQKANVALANIKSLSIATPYVFIAGQIIRALSKRVARKGGIPLGMQDYALGWHPALTAVDTIASSELPAVLIHTELFPVVDIALVWS